jgi:hypothetical protein
MGEVETLLAVTGLLASFDRPWWVAGGWAIDALAGGARRRHPSVAVPLAELIVMSPGLGVPVLAPEVRCASTSRATDRQRAGGRVGERGYDGDVRWALYRDTVVRAFEGETP